MPDGGTGPILTESRKYWMDQDENITLPVAKFLAKEEGVSIEDLNTVELTTVLRFTDDVYLRRRIFKHISSPASV